MRSTRIAGHGPVRIHAVLAAIAILVVATTTTGTPASAAVPEEVVFPQDAELTTFTNSWGATRSGGRRHTGTDLLAPKMSPVFSVADGVVTKLDWSSLGGYGLWIDHGGFVSVYLHLNNDTPGTDDGKGYPDWTYAPGLEVGTPVSAGQFVGWVGDSGNAERTTPHTHVEFHIDGAKVNPHPWLLAAWHRGTGPEVILAVGSVEGDPNAEPAVAGATGMFAE